MVNSFSGVRQLIKSSIDPNKATRGYAIQVDKDLISVFGGKWTTARCLAKKVGRKFLYKNSPLLKDGIR
jgi:glycerol-3-phosphate dehydrogenase